jgi:hypothetical protein
MAVALGYLIGMIPLRPGFGPEILSRTQPTLFDLLIAFFSGLAGAYALVNPRVSPGIAGVAIATAIVPPLATCGLCLANRQPVQAGGAFLLFLVNFLAIQFSAASVFMLANLEERPEALIRGRLGRFLVKFGPGLALLIALGVFLTNVLVGIVNSRKIEEQVTRHLSELLSANQGAQLDALKLDRKPQVWQLTAEVMTPQAFTPEAVATFEDELGKRLTRPLHLVLRSLITRDCDREGPVFISETERLGLDASQKEAQLLQEVSTVLGREVRDLPGTSLTDLRRDESGQGLAFLAVVQAPSAVIPERVGQLEDAVKRQLGRPVRLVVRTIQTRDTDSQGFLLTDRGQLPEASPAEVELKRKVEASISSHLDVLPEGASLAELRFVTPSEGLSISATFRAFRAITPDEVQRLQHALRLEVQRELVLTVHTAVQASATAEEYVTTNPEQPVPAS